MTKFLRRSVAMLATACFVPFAAASLISSNVGMSLIYDQDNLGPGGTQFNGSAIVGAGIEFTVPLCSDCPGNVGGSAEGTMAVDLDAFSIMVSQIGSQFPDVLLFDLNLTNLDLGPGLSIIGVVPTEQNPFTVSFTGNSLRIQNLENFNPPSNFTNTYRLIVNDVPEPNVLAMVGLGLLGLAATRRRA